MLTIFGAYVNDGAPLRPDHVDKFGVTQVGEEPHAGMTARSRIDSLRGVPVHREPGAPEKFGEV